MNISIIGPSNSRPKLSFKSYMLASSTAIIKPIKNLVFLLNMLFKNNNDNHRHNILVDTTL